MIAAAAALAALLGGAAAAQGGGAFRADLVAVAKDHKFSGEQQFAPDRVLHEGRAATQTFKVKADEDYIVAGFCDLQCGNMGLRVTDAAGAILADSQNDSDKPMLGFHSDKAGTVTVATAMAECHADDGCAYGVALFGAGGKPAMSEAAYDAVRDKIDAQGREAGLVRAGEAKTGALAVGAHTRVDIEIDPAKKYVVIGRCDDACTDIDLWALRKGNADDVMLANTAPNAEPTLTLDPGVSGHKVYVQVDMGKCAAKACAFAVGVFTKP